MASQQSTSVDRRNFLKIAGMAGAALAAGATVAGCSSEKAQATASYLPEKWDYEADIVVIGHGGAGLSAAITAYDEDLGSVIMLEAAEEEYRGGNSRVCGQNMMIPDDPEEAIKYQRALNDVYILDDDPEKEQALYEAWAYGLAENKEWLENLGANVTATNMNSHEFPEIEGSEKGGTCYLLDNIVGQSAVWNFLDEEKTARDIETYFNTRALKLVRNPEKNEVLGVEADKDGSTVYFKARKGVVLACGGFERDAEMMRNEFILGSTITTAQGNGTPYNRGDGFRMIAPFGAKLWHMNNVMGPSIVYQGCGLDSDSGSCLTMFTSKDFIFVGPNGRRYANEDFGDTARHSKVLLSGIYQPARIPMSSWTVFGQACFDAGNIFSPFSMGWENVSGGIAGTDNQSYVDNGVILKADTIEELAEKIGVDAGNLAETIKTYNSYCETGVDLEFHRGEPLEVESSLMNSMGLEDEGSGEGVTGDGGYDLVPIEGPFYALKQLISCINTQGGPKRGTGGEVIDVFEQPVPRLYAAGEFGTIYSYQYNGGGNLSEALSSGRIAVRSIGALEPWDAEK